MAPIPYEGEDRRAPSSYLPWWVRTIVIIGPTSAIAIYLVYIVATEVPKLKAEQIAIHAEVAEGNRLLMRHVEQEAAVFRMTQRVCSNTARTEEQRQRCFDEK